MVATAESIPAGRQVQPAVGTGGALAVAGCLFAAAVVTLSFATAPDGRVGSLAACCVGIAMPIGLGLFRLSRRRDDRFAAQLLAAGVLWSLICLAESNDGVLFGIGRIAAWAVEVTLVYLILAFPSGRLRTATDRRLVWAAAALAGLLYLPTVLVVPFPEPSAWAPCVASCPDSAFVIGSGHSAVADDVIRPLREVLTVIVFAGVAAVMVRRTTREGAVGRRLLAPVAVIALLRVVVMAVYLALRGADTASGLQDVLGWIFLSSLPGVTLAFAAGLLSRRLFVGRALQRLTLSLRPHATAPELREAMAIALEDPELRIVYWRPGEPGGWADETGSPARAPGAEPGRGVTEVVADGRRIAAVSHDAALLDIPDLVRAAAAYALTTLENERLVGRLESSLRDLSASRARIVAIAAEERRSIERDLHDGAQQRLVALRIKLELMAERLDGDLAVRALQADVDATIDLVRGFAQGVYPPLLAERGLSEALRAAGRGAPLPTVVDVAQVDRYPPEIEATVYFACMEALQNAAKHAHGASGVTIVVAQDAGLRFEVRDDGPGFEVEHAGGGAGLTNLRDRLEAVGGRLTIRSSGDTGTCVSGVIPTNGNGRGRPRPAAQQAVSR
jgi:signal transduction histidine kinase